MRRFLAMSAAVATVAIGLLAPTAAASADEDGDSSISGVSTSWASGTVSVRFDYDSWAYGRVEAFVDGAGVGTTVLPSFGAGRSSLSFARPASAGSAPVTVRVTSCDEDPVDPAASCTTTSAYSGTLIVARSVPKGKANALTLLNALPVKAEAHASTYKRARFTLWIDANGDGESTRVEVLKAESTKKVTINAHGTVTKGRWVSQYDGKTFTLGSKLDIDHLVPLEEAWTSGASSWSAKKREAYANDLGYGASLIAVSAHANRSKGDKDPAQWLPSRKSYDCTYVRNYIAVKSRWKLSVDRAEKQALTTTLATCSSYAVARPGTPDIAKLVPKAKPKKHTGGGTSSGSGGTTSGLDPRYATCTELLRHPNHAPYRRGVDPEYNWYTDRDGDGLVCE